MLQSDLGPERPADPIEMLNLVARRAMQHYRWAALRCDSVPEDEFFERTIVGDVPNRWFRLEQSQGDRVAALAATMVRNDLGERMARIREAEAVMMMASIRRVLDRLDLTPEQRAKVGPALRAEAASIMTHVEEIPALEAAA